MTMNHARGIHVWCAKSIVMQWWPFNESTWNQAPLKRRSQFDHRKLLMEYLSQGKIKWFDWSRLPRRYFLGVNFKIEHHYPLYKQERFSFPLSYKPHLSPKPFPMTPILVWYSIYTQNLTTPSIYGLQTRIIQTLSSPYMYQPHSYLCGGIILYSLSLRGWYRFSVAALRRKLLLIPVGCGLTWWSGDLELNGIWIGEE